MEKTAAVPKLYNYFRSSASWRVRIALNIKKMKYDYVAVNLLKGEQKDGDYAKLNPMKVMRSLFFFQKQTFSMFLVWKLMVFN